MITDTTIVSSEIQDKTDCSTTYLVEVGFISRGRVYEAEMLVEQIKNKKAKKSEYSYMAKVINYKQLPYMKKKEYLLLAEMASDHIEEVKKEFNKEQADERSVAPKDE